MRKLFILFTVISSVVLVSCGESADEKAAREQRLIDSIDAQEALNAEREALEAQKLMEEQQAPADSAQ
jgi:uncharacterized protein YcfL